MRRYSQADEEIIRAKALVREWRSSGLLEASQAGRLESDLRVNLRRTNSFFRAVLFLFTAVTVTASLWLIIATFHLDDRAGFLNRRTIVLNRTKAGWKIVHLHASEVSVTSKQR